MGIEHVDGYTYRKDGKTIHVKPHVRHTKSTKKTKPSTSSSKTRGGSGTRARKRRTAEREARIETINAQLGDVPDASTPEGRAEIDRRMAPDLPKMRRQIDREVEKNKRSENPPAAIGPAIEPGSRHEALVNREEELDRAYQNLSDEESFDHDPKRAAKVKKERDRLRREIRSETKNAQAIDRTRRLKDKTLSRRKIKLAQEDRALREKIAATPDGPARRNLVRKQKKKNAELMRVIDERARRQKAAQSSRIDERKARRKRGENPITGERLAPTQHARHREAARYQPKGRTDESSFDYTDDPQQLRMRFSKEQLQEAYDTDGMLKFDYEETVPKAALAEALGIPLETKRDVKPRGEQTRPKTTRTIDISDEERAYDEKMGKPSSDAEWVDRAIPEMEAKLKKAKTPEAKARIRKTLKGYRKFKKDLESGKAVNISTMKGVPSLSKIRKMSQAERNRTLFRLRAQEARNRGLQGHAEVWEERARSVPSDEPRTIDSLTPKMMQEAMREATQGIDIRAYPTAGVGKAPQSQPSKKSQKEFTDSAVKSRRGNQKTTQPTTAKERKAKRARQKTERAAQRGLDAAVRRSGGSVPKKQLSQDPRQVARRKRRAEAKKRKGK